MIHTSLVHVWYIQVPTIPAQTHTCTCTQVLLFIQLMYLQSPVNQHYLNLNSKLLATLWKTEIHNVPQILNARVYISCGLCNEYRFQLLYWLHVTETHTAMIQLCRRMMYTNDGGGVWTGITMLSLTSLLPRVCATNTREASVNLWSSHTFSFSMFGQFLIIAINPASVMPSHFRRFKYFKLFDAIDWMPSLVICLSLRSFSSSTSQRILDRLIIPLSVWRRRVAEEEKSGIQWEVCGGGGGGEEHRVDSLIT